MILANIIRKIILAACIGNKLAIIVTIKTDSILLTLSIFSTIYKKIQQPIILKKLVNIIGYSMSNTKILKIKTKNILVWLETPMNFAILMNTEKIIKII